MQGRIHPQLLTISPCSLGYGTIVRPNGEQSAKRVEDSSESTSVGDKEDTEEKNGDKSEPVTSAEAQPPGGTWKSCVRAALVWLLLFDFD